MRIWIVAALSAACTIAPRYVTVPMSDVAVTTPTAATATASETEEESSSTDDYSGAWSASAWASGNTWPLTVTFEKRGPRELFARVQYTDRRCRAEWTLRRVSGTATHWEGSETVNVDPFSRCLNHAQIFADIVDEDTLRWRWVAGGTSATALLKRQQH